ncbi:MAG TPA: PHP domain-containing protein [Acidimicrobiales bacterium]|nr:PHP domain-containing protein [Acidimicrobiales bacterium]
MIDLHVHSAVSDGTDPPEAIPELAATAGCSAVALTDHDTLAGLDVARKRAVQVGVELVGGCEVSCAFSGASTHVLVYFVDHEEGALHDELARLREDRVRRNRRLAELLASLGIPITYEEAVAVANTEDSLGRPHFAGLLVAKGAAESIPDAFDRWLALGRPAFVSKARVHPAQIARAARAAGGVCVLAHPLTLGLGADELDRAVVELVEAGFSGIEAHYANYRPEQRRSLAELAARHDLVATGGSDYHGTVKPGLAVGTGRGDLLVPDEVLERLTARRP